MTAHLKNLPTVAMRLYGATLGLAIAAFVFSVTPASASNLLGGTISWVPDQSTPNTAVFTLTVVHRRDDPDLIVLSGGAVDGRPEVGDVYRDNSKVKSFFFGDGAPLQSSDINFKAIAVDKVQNYVIGQVLEVGSTTNTTVRHTYRNASPQIAETRSWCCRPGYDQLNHGRTLRLASKVAFDASSIPLGQGSPTSGMFGAGGIKKVGLTGKQSFFVPATSGTGGTSKTLNWRFADRLSAETGSRSFFGLPGATIDAATGLISWDPSNLPPPNRPFAPQGSAWSCAVVVEDRNATGDTVKTSIMVDFEVVVCGDGKPPVAFVPPTPACGSTMVAAVGEELSFTVQLDAATDTVPGRALGVTGLPPGATLTPALPALGTTFRWTPTQAAKGSYTVTFSAYDVCAPKGGALTQCSYTIKVGNRPDCSRVRFTYKGQPGPPNGLLWPVNIEGVTDADGDPLTYTYSVTQDENPASGACPDAVVLGSGSSDLQVRSERDGNGDGRVYYVHYTATETGALGLSCSGVDSICIPNGGPHARCTDNGQNFSSFGPCLGQVQSEAGGITSAITRVGIKLVHATSTETAFEYALPADSDVQLGIYDIAGRLVETLENSRQTAGVHRVAWRTGGMAHGIYYYRLRAGAVLISKSLMILK